MNFDMFTHDDVKATVMRQLRSKDSVTSESIRNAINLLVNAWEAANLVETIDRDGLFREISNHISVWQPDPSVLRDPNHINWVPDCKSKIEWNFWKRYRDYLEDEKLWSRKTTAKLDSATDNILGDIGNPFQPGSWDRRGMVVGDVQSGKTANYTGLICKATDAGYKLIIVLAGMTNDLRSQTQSRLDAEFLGFESHLARVQEAGARIGVGRLDGYGNLIAHTLTFGGTDGDFRERNGANIQLGGSPLLLVVKKNTSVLKRILRWVRGHGKNDPTTGQQIVYNTPLLLLDDEADNASVNTANDDDDPNAINRNIREILNAFSQRSYIGYTATPFANIFILPDEERDDPARYGQDLFPKNFIYYINPPSNYVGATQIFGLNEDLDGIGESDSSLPLIRSAEDGNSIFPPRHTTNLKVTSLPESLVEAIYVFIITCAARRARGQKDVHNSMLIHVTRYVLVQDQVIDLVKEELVNLRRTLEYRTGDQFVALLAKFQELWTSDFEPTSAEVSDKIMRSTTDELQVNDLVPISWEKVSEELYEAALKITVEGINGLAGGQLNYSDHPLGLNVIAIGGDKLSRGLTLESLSISYYLRPAKNYDTLLQMGRWFGYRPGYLDLCRIYTTQELVEWYQHIALATEELKREFRLMQASNLTPKDYGLKVRTHPNGLNITAANKIRNGTTMQVTFSGQLSQTTVFHKDDAIQRQNFEHTNNFLKTLGNNFSEIKNNKVWKLTTAASVIQFLNGFKTHPLCRNADPDLLKKYISKLNDYDELTNWTVALISSATAENKFNIAGHSIGLLTRTDKTPDSDIYMLAKSNIISPSDQYIDLEDLEKQNAIDATIKAWEAGLVRMKKRPDTPSGPFIRENRPKENGLLLIYPLNPCKVLYKDSKVTDHPIIGFAISFPKGSNDEKIEYRVNTQYWRERYGSEEDDYDA